MTCPVSFARAQVANWWWGMQCNSAGVCSLTESPGDYWAGQVGTYDSKGMPLTMKSSSGNYMCASIGSGGPHVLPGLYVFSYTGTVTLSFQQDAVFVPSMSTPGSAVFNVSTPGTHCMTFSLYL